MGNDLLPHLSNAARAARAAAGCTTTTVARAATVDPATVRRFERGRAWPKDPDTLVKAYAKVAGVNPRDIWADALARWRPTPRG